MFWTNIYSQEECGNVENVDELIPFTLDSPPSA